MYRPNKQPKNYHNKEFEVQHRSSSVHISQTISFVKLVLRYGSVWISFVLSIQEGCTENVVKFFSSLIALDYYQKHNRKERIKLITQNNVLYKEDLKKLFQTPAITITDVLQKRNLCQSILPYIKEILKRLGNPDPCKIISVLNPEENETSNTPDLGDIR